MSIRAENITVKAARRILLDDVSFEASAGELVAVVGSNGAGKSTLLKTLCGGIGKFRGGVYFGGKDLRHWKSETLAKVRAVLPQNFGLNFPFRVREVALLGRTPHIGFNESVRDHEIAGRALEKVGIAGLADRFYPTLSGGEKQRVQLARVLTQVWERPENSHRFLLLDEPTTGLDPAQQHLTLQTVREFADEKTCVIAVLHDLNLAAQYADRILVLKNGRIAAFGRPKTVLNAHLIRGVFGIEVHIAGHFNDERIPLIVPTGRVFGREKVF